MTENTQVPEVSPETRKKLEHLQTILDTGRPLGVAFSGGVDSAFLLAVAARRLGKRVTAFTAASPLHPAAETRAAADLAQKLGVAFVMMETGEMDLPAFTVNAKDRCYVCKRHMLELVWAECRDRGISRLVHGANADDMSDHRPGMRAANEMGVAAPLLEAGLSKAEIRALSFEMGLPTWDKPSMACLASRIPYTAPVTLDALRRVEICENVLTGLGFSGVRVRHHGPVARIEAAPEDLKSLVSENVREQIIREFKKAGFYHVSLDLEGYVSGALNRVLGEGA